MSTVHVMTRAADFLTCEIVVHLPAPTGTNAGNQQWDNVLKWGKGTGSRISWLERKHKDEYKQLQAGRLLEVTSTVTFTDASLTKIQRRNEIRAHVQTMLADIQDPASDLYKATLAPYEIYGYSFQVAPA